MAQSGSRKLMKPSIEDQVTSISPTWSVKDTEKIFSLQNFHLSLFGFLVSRKTTGALLIAFSKLLSAFFVVAIWANFTINGVAFWGRLFPPTGNETDYFFELFKGAKNAGIMMGMIIAPESLTTFRSAAVVTFLFYQRRKWNSLYEKMTNIITENLPSTRLNQYLSLWKWWSVGHIILVLLLYSGNPILDRVPSYIQYGYEGFVTFSTIFYPLPFALNAREEFIRAAVGIIPAAVLSKVFYSSIVVFAKLLSDSIKFLNFDITKERDRLTLMRNSEKGVASVDFAVCQKNIRSFTRRYENLCDSCGYFNNFFGNILFLMWGLDAMTAMAFLGNIIINRQPDMGFVVLTYYGLVSYLASAVFLLFPVAFVHEQGEQTAIHLHRLSTAFGSISNTEHVQSIQKQIDHDLLRLLMASRDRQLVVHGAHLVYFTRTFFATNLTVAISFGMVTQQFLTS